MIETTGKWFKTTFGVRVRGETAKNSPSTKREISSYKKTNFFKGKREKSNLFLSKPYMAPLSYLKPIEIRNSEFDLKIFQKYCSLILIYE